MELVDGRVEVPEMPTKSHQKIVQFLLQLLLTFLAARRLGDAVSAPYRVRVRDRTYREPDIVVYLAEHLSRFGERYGEGADLVVEVVSEDAASRARDYEDKRRDYAEAKIPEYWIVDPFDRRILVLCLQGQRYDVFGEFAAGDQAQSRILSGFCVDVDHVVQAGEESLPT
jgi:Uma2 family endonuclease